MRAETTYQETASALGSVQKAVVRATHYSSYAKKLLDNKIQSDNSSADVNDYKNMLTRHPMQSYILLCFPG